MHRYGIVGLLLAAALGLPGCGVLHSEARNKQGDELKASYAKVDLTEHLATSRKNRSALLDEQLKLEDENWRQYGLSHAHLAATNWKVRDLKFSINERMVEIVGVGFSYQSVLAAKTAPERAEVPAGGEYGGVRDELNRLQATQEAVIREKKCAEKAVKDASAEYSELLKDLSKSPEHAKKLDAARQKLTNALGKLDKLESAVGREFTSSAKVEGLSEFLATYDSVRAGKGAADGSNRAAIAIALFPEIQDQIDKAFLDAQSPRLLPLVLAKQVEQVKLSAAQRDLARVETTLGLKQQQLNALWAQIDLLNRALKGLGSLRDDQPLRPLLLPAKTGQTLSDTEISSRMQAWRPLALYLNAQIHVRAKQNKLQHQIIALGYEEPLSLAESNIQTWKALLDPSVELLSMYGASGLKAQDIQGLVNALALAVIAIGVN